MWNMFKVYNNTKIKTPEDVNDVVVVFFIVNFEHILLLLLILNR